MIEKAGDLWTFPADARVITTNTVVRPNGCLVMGAGVALQAKQKHPSIDAILGGFVKKYGDRVCYLPNFDIIAYPTKRNWKNNSDIKLIENGAYELMELATYHELDTIVMPRPGCGNGGLKWVNVKPILEKILDERFIIVS